jgi:hypothetical protein
MHEEESPKLKKPVAEQVGYQKQQRPDWCKFRDNAPALLLVKRARESVLKTFIHRSW